MSVVASSEESRAFDLDVGDLEGTIEDEAGAVMRDVNGGDDGFTGPGELEERDDEE